MTHTELETHLTENYAALERYIKFRISDKDLADDLVQDICLTVLTHGESLRQPESFRPWLYRIARNRLNDVYRSPEREREIRTDRMDSFVSRRADAFVHHDAVSETLARLGDGDRRLLMLCYMSDITQKEAAEQLGIPLGTLKTRLTAAKKRFRERYPYTKEMERTTMKKRIFPEIMPEYTITQRPDAPFEVVHEAIIGWGIVPRLGEKCAWAAYDFPEKKLTETMHLEVTGRAEVHGIEGVEIKTVESGWNSSDNLVFAMEETERWFIAQLTDTHCRLLAESHIEDGVKKCYTFLDGASFLDNWGFGEDNCGFETHLRPHGWITKDGERVTVVPEPQVIDICGRFDVTIAGKMYDTICLMDVESYDTKVLTETYIDREGRIVLWRRFNRNDWGQKRIGQLWTERFPENEHLTVNGEIYVHWYDCIYDWILK
ncbi:MAG: RNA polymerase sigma factor [Clostridia bacterium]|nr:RNA polymerase sigma factor [Clostridia bacterium]